MNALRFVSQSSISKGFVSCRSVHTSRPHNKALKNWERPSIDELGVPQEPWRRVFDRNQKKFNAQLLAGVGLFAGTVMVAANYMDFNITPAFLKDVQYSTITPDSSKRGEFIIWVGPDL